jgi:hypothetical protein
VVVSASNCFDPVRGLNVLFVGPYNQFANADRLPVITSNQTLPDDDNPTPHLDVISNNTFLAGNLLYFGSADTFSGAPNGFYGQYYAPLNPGGAPLTPAGSPIYRVFDNSNSGVTGSFGQFGGTAFDAGTLAFIATDSTSGVGGIYQASGAVPTLMTTDLQRGVPSPVGWSQGRLAFSGAGFFDPQLDFVSHGGCGVAPVASISITTGRLKAGANGGEYTQNVTLQNTGANAITGAIDVLLTDLTAGVSLLDGNGVTACVAPIGSPFIIASTGAEPLKPGHKLSITLDFWNPAKVKVRYTSVVVGGAGAP